MESPKKTNEQQVKIVTSIVNGLKAYPDRLKTTQSEKALIFVYLVL